MRIHKLMTLTAGLALLAAAPLAVEAAESRGLFGISGRMAGNPAPPKPSKQPPAEIFPAAQLWSGAGRSLGGARSWTYETREHAGAGVLERHDGWNDVVMIHEGRGVLVSGGVLAGARDEGGGEHRGGALSGEVKRQPIGPGDVVMIPAGLPHQVVAEGAGRIRYLVVRTRG